MKKKPINRIGSSWLSLFLLMPVSLPAFAAAQSSWLIYLLAVMALSLVAAVVLSLRNEKAESVMGKLLLTGLYFWVLTFAQLIVLALIYYMT